MCEIIIDGKTVKFEGTVLTKEVLKLYRKRARHITICDSVTEIREYAFLNFRKLENIEISDSVKVIGNVAFDGCSVLKSIAFPNSITELKTGVCMGCKSIKNVVIPNSVQIIGNSIFLGCNALKSIHIPRSVTKIEGFAFCGCKSLKNIKIPDSITHIGNSAFEDCASLKSIEIPESVTYIGDRAFRGCNDIRIKINDSSEFLSQKTLLGNRGQIVTINIAGDEYSVLTVYNNVSTLEGATMVITGDVNYAGGKLYSGYEFGDDLDTSIKLSMCCYVSEENIFYDTAFSGLKRQLEKVGIR